MTAKPVSQDSKGQIRETGHHTEVADPILVASGKENADAVTHHPPTNTISNIPSQQHPLHKKVVLIMCHLSGNSSKTEGFRQQQPKSLNPHGQLVHESNVKDIWGDGDNIVVNGISIPFLPL